MQTKKPKRLRDPNQLAKLIVSISVGEVEDDAPVDDGKDPAAVALGRKGGAARAKSLSGKERSEIAKKAAKARRKSGE